MVVVRYDIGGFGGAAAAGGAGMVVAVAVRLPDGAEE